MKYRQTYCSDPEHLKLFKVLIGYQPVDLRKKYYTCLHCKKLHETKDIPRDE